MAKLKIQPASGEAFEVEIANTATIGRLRDSTVCLNFSPLASRQHAIIRCHNGYEYQLIDLGSRNGTLVNGQRVIMPVTLANGSRIQIADTELIFEQEDSSSDDQSLEATLAGTMSGPQVSSHEVALMVCDIRGFSTMAEKIPSSDLAQVLGAWFRESGNAIQKSGGTIDKFIGDAVLAYWPKSDLSAEPCDTALQAGRTLLGLASSMKWPDSILPRPNGLAPTEAAVSPSGTPKEATPAVEQAPVSIPQFKIAVALHFGKVTCSNIGMVAQRDATIIGDAVNTVFRLEATMKQLGHELILSADFAAGMRSSPPLHDLGEHSLKGKAQAVRIFGLA
jgi:adenylate cyclase